MTQIEAMCKLLVDDGHMTPLAARKVLQVAKIDADRLAKVQELLNQPCTQDFVCGRWPGRVCVCWKADLRDALGGEA